MPRAQGNVEQLIRKHVGDRPGETWLKWKDEEHSWNETLSNVQRAANGLLELGVRPGDRVAIMMGNRPEFLWTHFAILFIGAHSVPVNISQRGATLHHILADSSSAAVVVAEELRDHFLAVRDDLPELRHAVVVDGRPGEGIDWDFDRLMAGADTDPDVDLDEPTGGVGMMYTSGTTGPPKGVVATKYDLSPLQIILEATGVKPGETMYTPLPLYHGNALLISALGSIFLGAKLALGERFSASGFWDEVRKYEAVECNTLGAMIPILLKQPPRPDEVDNPVRVVLSAACPAESWREFEDRFGVKIVEFFGMVDSPGFLLNAEGKVGSMGKPIADVEFRVVDDEDRPLGAGEVGQLLFRHPQGQLTYYENRPDATDQAYRGGWFHTGDLAEYDEDGWFYYRGRKRESIRRRGENISAWEIETVVNQHPAVLESAAHAVPSDLGEDEVKLVVVPKAGQTPTPEEILDFCKGKIAYYAIPRYVELMDALPKGGTERIQYGVLRQRGITAQTWDREQAGYDVARD